MNPSSVAVQPLEADFSFKAKAYQALRDAIMGMNLYDRPDEIRLDERQLAADLGVSRTPIREAMARLEHEGLVRTVPRRGIFVVRKSKQEIVETIMVWAALESMAARLATQVASDDEIASLRSFFSSFTNGNPSNGRLRAHLDEYSEANIRFHQRIINISHNEALKQLTDNIFLHVRSIRRTTIGEADRVNRSIVDHLHIIEAIERRDAEQAETLVRNHALDLAAHVAAHVTYLE